MANKTCWECKYFKQNEEICLHDKKHYWSKKEFDACAGFEAKPVTNGDVIRQKARGKMSKTCGECRHFDNDCQGISKSTPASYCEEFERKPTVFQQITASPEVLAPYFVFLKAVVVTNYNPKQQWISTLTEEVYPTRSEALAATVAKLKEVCNAKSN